MSPLGNTWVFFSIYIGATALPNVWLAESTDLELQIQRVDYKVTHGFDSVGLSPR